MDSSKVDEILSLKPKWARKWETGEDGHIALLVPKFEGGLLGRILTPRLRDPYFRVHLDQIGTFVYLSCDGNTCGDEIAEILSQRFADIKMPRERTALFLHILFSQGHVSK